MATEWAYPIPSPSPHTVETTLQACRLRTLVTASGAFIKIVSHTYWAMLTLASSLLSFLKLVQSFLSILPAIRSPNHKLQVAVESSKNNMLFFHYMLELELRHVALNALNQLIARHILISKQKPLNLFCSRFRSSGFLRNPDLLVHFLPVRCIILPHVVQQVLFIIFAMGFNGLLANGTISPLAIFSMIPISFSLRLSLAYLRWYSF